MSKISFINKDVCILFLISIFFNFYFFFLTYNNYNYCANLRPAYGDIAYNFYLNNSLKSNNERINYTLAKVEAGGRILEYSEITPEMFEEGDYPHIAIAPWYGVILGTLWKITHSLSYKDIILVQILLFTLCILLFYHSAYIMFHSRFYAMSVGISTILFFPLMFHNVLVLREIWMFYGAVILMYSILRYLYKDGSAFILCIGGICFAFSQLIRFTCIPTLLFIIFFTLINGIFSNFPWKKIRTTIAILLGTNILCFWIPFFVYNRHAYNRFFVGSLGEILITGLGEFPNKWGYKFCDAWFTQYMKEHYSLIEGTPECDDKAKEMWRSALFEDFPFYISTITRRIHKMIIPNLSWLPALYYDKTYAQLPSLRSRLHYLFSPEYSYKQFFIMLIGLLYVRIFILLGYIGLLLMFFKKYYQYSLLLLGIIISSWYIIFMHAIECRYVVPTFGFIPFGTAYCWYYFYSLVLKKKTNVFLSTLTN